MDPRTEAFIRAKAKCSKCHAALGFSHYGDLRQATGWALHERPDGQIEPVCSECERRGRGCATDH